MCRKQVLEYIHKPHAQPDSGCLVVFACRKTSVSHRETSFWSTCCSPPLLKASTESSVSRFFYVFVHRLMPFKECPAVWNLKSWILFHMQSVASCRQFTECTRNDCFIKRLVFRVENKDVREVVTSTIFVERSLCYFLYVKCSQLFLMAKPCINNVPILLSFETSFWIAAHRLINCTLEKFTCKFLPKQINFNG